MSAIVKRQNHIQLKEVRMIGKNIKRANEILALGKIIGMKAKFYAESIDNAYSRKLENVLQQLKNIESSIK